MNIQSSAVTIGSTAIRQHNGLYSLNDLHKASGNDDKHQPSFFLRNDQTQALINEIQSANMQTAIETINGGKYRGTYACRELVIAYAAWISAAFQLQVIRVFLCHADNMPANGPAARAWPDGERSTLKALADKVASTNYRMVDEHRTTITQLRQCNARMGMAHVLATEAAAAVSKKVFAAVTNAGPGADIVHERWLLALSEREPGQPPVPSMTRLEGDVRALSVQDFIDGLRTGDMGDALSEHELSQVAHAALESIARRLPPAAGVSA